MNCIHNSSMKDKYGLIIKYESNFDINDYKYFFENLIKTSKKVIIPNYIYYNLNILTDKKNKCDDEMLNREELLRSIDSCIKDSLNEYIRKTRQQVRDSLKIRNNNNLISTYLTCIKKFNNKVNTIKSFRNYSNEVEIFNNFFNTLFCDPFIHNTNILKNELMDVKKYKYVKYLGIKMSKVCNSFYNTWYIPFIKSCLRGNLNLDINIPDIKKCLVPVYQYSIFVNYYNTYKTHFNYLTKDLSIIECLSSVLIKDIFNPLSKLNTIVDFNTFLKENYKSLNFIGKALSRADKESIELYIANNTNSNINVEVSLEEICNFYVTISRHYSKTFPTICSLYCKKISQLINSKDLYGELNELIIKTINNEKMNTRYNIDSNVSNNSSDNLDKESSILNLVDIISNLSNKDAIFKNYHGFLMTRLLNNKIGDIKDISSYCKSYYQFELNLINYLLKCFNNGQIYILKKTLEDYIGSILINNKYLFPDIINPVVISNNIWDLSILSNGTSFDEITTKYPREIISEHESLIKSIFKYSVNYCNYFQKTKYLDWYLHVGKVELRYSDEDDSSSCVLTLLPIQALVLEQFEEIEEKSIEEIFDLSFTKNYPREEIDNLLRIFVINKLMIHNNGLYSLNKDFVKKDLDLRKSYFNISQVLKESIIKDDIKLCNDRIDIVKSVINSLLKIKGYYRDNLYDLTVKSIKLFDLDNDLFDKSIEYLKTRDYITENSGFFEKINY